MLEDIFIQHMQKIFFCNVRKLWRLALLQDFKDI